MMMLRIAYLVVFIALDCLYAADVCVKYSDPVQKMLSPAGYRSYEKKLKGFSTEEECKKACANASECFKMKKFTTRFKSCYLIYGLKEVPATVYTLDECKKKCGAQTKPKCVAILYQGGAVKKCEMFTKKIDVAHLVTTSGPVQYTYLNC